ncbi:ATP-dependent nuclease [Atopomonas hussainii]|uniref:ATP-dependent nuclease n=1 Tax=Atopomonas hussainii TaxID=1429083 RepID=UPI0008FFF9D1|nr:AAA family ATPase [Atopomonas hussainii]
MKIEIEISNVQHIKKLKFNLDLSQCKLTCIIGKNGVGKTTLIKSIKNLALADTFAKTSAGGIFNESSTIFYRLGNDDFIFAYDASIKSLNCKTIIPAPLKSALTVELPMPYGERFNFFQSISDADPEIRRAIILEQYEKPAELIEFLHDIYSESKFENLVEVKIKNRRYYCILIENSKYIREDYLSSGEYFLINLYRKITEQCQLIVIDEIDISLDAAAQAHLIRKLREFCSKYKVNIFFTTHSLAMMRTLRSNEMLYMQTTETETHIYSASYNYIKSLLFGFSGWDKYILTEDDVLQKFIEYIISRYCKNIFFKYKIIYIGGSPNVAGLLRRNISEGFFSDAQNVIAVLDGDQRHLRLARRPSTFCIPQDSVEKALFEYYQEDDFHPKLPETYNEPKRLYEALIRERKMTEQHIFSYLCDRRNDDMIEFAKNLNYFLSHSN